ncbi:hypothetical protein ABBQ38_013039 [Trebouxia sp. C0009 RCD-2024]
MVVLGGGRCSLPSHDGNFIITHPTRFDKVFGMFTTQDGKIRCMDLIITPREEYPFCLLGWTGSKQYLRFLRQHAGNCNMYLNSYRQKLDRLTQHAHPLHLLEGVH